MSRTSRRRFLTDAGAAAALVTGAAKVVLGREIDIRWNPNTLEATGDSTIGEGYLMQAGVVPIDILSRPFSVEPTTGIMLPDGIFDAALHKQVITCFVTNTGSADLNNLAIYFEGIGDQNILVDKQTINIPSLQTGASAKVGWLGDFSRATPGKHLVTIRATAATFSAQRVYKKIFVSRTRYDHASKTYTCEVPEGTLKVQFDRLIGPKYPSQPENLPRPGPWLVSGFTSTLNGPFSGQDGPLAFEDPLWKIILAIIAVLAFIGSLLANAAGDNGSAVQCDTDPATGQKVCSSEGNYGAALLLIAGAALKGVLSDREDPWTRGRKATPPRANEKTVAEIVSATVEYPDEITAGQKYASKINWSYRRITNANQYSHSVTETVDNEYVMKSVVIRAPARLSLAVSPVLIIEAQITRDSGKIYKGPELIASAWLQAPNGEIVKVPLADDGIVDDTPNDGWYTGKISMAAAAELAHLTDRKGIWKIYALAQTVNIAKEGLTPAQASQFLGGDPVVAPVSLSYGARTCSPGQSIQVEVVD